MTDEGEGFDPEVIPDPRYGDNLYKPAGRGMLLMRSFMDVVEYNRQGNSVRMIRYREKRRQSKSAARVGT
jgi:anti-sigma regulatory factor (Ser/Thr protein kinase)